MRSLNDLQSNWNRLGEIDPLWAVLSHRDKKGNKWQVDELFVTGIKEIDQVLEDVQNYRVAIPRSRALDFGCGVGRLSQALARHFDVVDGIDIAPSMIELARAYNQYGARCVYHVNNSGDLSLFADGAFDFIYSNLVFQHIDPQYVKQYIEEFLRVLSTDGVLVFACMSAAPTIRGALFRVYNTLRAIRKLATNSPFMELYLSNINEITHLLRQRGAQILDIRTATDIPYYYRNRFFIVKERMESSK